MFPIPSNKNGSPYRFRLLHTVEKTIATYQMFQPGDAVLVGVSGGPDSVALLHALIILAPKFPLHIGIAHLNHSLRGKDSDHDAQFVKSLAKQLNLSIFQKKIDVRKCQDNNGGSLEEVARDLRNAFYHKVAEKKGFSTIALGHQADDNAELILLYICRGSGALGATGISPVREVSGKVKKIVRPLIRVGRSEIMGFLEQNRLPYVSDESNKDLTFLRNRIRHQLIPNLKSSYNPKIIDALNRFGLILSAEEEWAEVVIDSVFKKTILAKQDDLMILSAKRIAELHIAAQRRIIRKGIETVKGDLRRIQYSHIEAIVRLLKKGPMNGTLDLPDRIRILRGYERLLISKEKDDLRKFKTGFGIVLSFEYKMLSPGSLFIKEADISIKFSEIEAEDLTNVRKTGGSVVFMDKDKLSFPLTIRNVKPGDRFTPLGMTGTQKVKSFFINNKVPRPKRWVCPIMLSREKIMWVVGHRIDESVKVMPSTRRVLKAELFLA
ncbi:MAG TPA: tRNA lysidine(34) synthetase TilS [Desulfobacterales bacterium]|nr:tRNA lysidine(34) synthetase TilS [Desulfobacterales bacterium]